jgi:MerR family transcriptional regulator/heat shock protein HspR
MAWQIRAKGRPGEAPPERVHCTHPAAARAAAQERTMPSKRKSKGAYMISAVAEMYEIHPQTLRLYEREGLLKPSRTEGNTRLYTDEDLERLEFILNLARDLGVNIAGIAIILQMRERMEEMNRQMQGFVDYVRSEMLERAHQGFSGSNAAAMVPLRKPVVIVPSTPRERKR